MAKRFIPHSIKTLSQTLQALVESRLWVKILVASALGIGAGLWAGAPGIGLDEAFRAPVVEWVALPGKLFLALLQMIVVPLVFASVVRGLAASDSVDTLKRLGGWVSVYFVATLAVSVSVGMGLAYLVQPGALMDPAAAQGTETSIKALDTSRSIPQAILDTLPGNPVAALADGRMLQIVLLAALTGVALLQLKGAKAAPLLELLETIQAVAMKVVRWAMALAPLAVFGLLFKAAATTGAEALAGLGAYMATVLAGLGTVLAGYLALAWLAAGVSPARFFSAAGENVLLAFSTSSSAATLPVTLRTAEDRLKVRGATARFVVPLGTTINMDGTGLYQGVATVFLAQAYGVELGLGALALVVVTAVGGSVGSPGTPGVGLAVLAAVLSGVGIPAEGIGLILGVDRILDMARTSVNVSGDLTASLVMDRWVGGKIARKR